MANSFFDFDTSLNNGEHLLPPDDDDCVENEEEEYDALNDETFGTLEDCSELDNNWEQQHEQFAIAESSKHSDHLENSITSLVLDDVVSDPLNLSRNSVWSYTPPTNKNGGDMFNSSAILSSLQKASKSFIEQKAPMSPIQPPPKQICTVEELEKNLIKNSQSPQQQPIRSPYPPPLFHTPPRLPPGFPPIGLPPPPGHRMPLPMPLHPPPGLVPMYPPPHPHFMQGPMQQQRHPLLYPHHHPFNYPPPHQRHLLGAPLNQAAPPQHLQQHQQQHFPHPSMQHQSPSRNYSNGTQPRAIKDEYAGLMSMREKQWLLNIQMLQLNTGTPYFDDYYYTMFKERKAKSNKENLEGSGNNFRFGGNNINKRNNDRGDNNNTLTPRVYTPLVFENSLGKLQCGSVTAPRKIIDMDIVTPDKDSDGTGQVVRDSRKTKQLLLELEALFTLLLKAEDLRNPMAITNLDKLREIKQKQRLRELELAPTPEQKQEVLKLLKQDSEPIVENPHEYIAKIAQSYLNDEKFASFLNIRKGKMLLLRLLPHLYQDVFGAHLLDVWTRLMTSLAVVGRRDTSGDHILPKFHPFFKRFVQTCRAQDLLDIVTVLTETVRLDTSSRSTPLSHQSKAPLYFVMSNKFGVSALVTMLIRMEYLVSTGSTSEQQQCDWSKFLVAWSEQAGALIGGKVATPIEPLPKPIFTKHCNRFELVTEDRRALLEKYFVDSS